MNSICIFTETCSNFPLSSRLCLFSRQAGSVYCSHGIVGANRKICVLPFTIHLINEEVEWLSKSYKERCHAKINDKKIHLTNCFIYLSVLLCFKLLWSKSNRKQPGKGQKGNCGNWKYCACWFKLLLFWKREESTRAPRCRQTSVA